jgi:two-component system phosphate regulon sensor histidine kinase PhoR
MLKNLTPRQIAIYSSGLIVAFNSVSILLFVSLGILPFNWSFLLFIVLLGITAYASVLFYVKKYIYRKIKLIYKNIHDFKLKPAEKKKDLDVDSDIILEVEKEVAEWAQEQQAEINTLKEMESYRRLYLGNVSHELKTPIFNIQGFIHTLIEGGIYDDNINMNYLQRAAKNVERLQTIVTDLEAINKLESGKLAMDMQVFDLKILAGEVFEDLEIKAKERNIALGYKDGADQNFKVEADREGIRQVLVNLIENSIKYGKENGRTKIGFYDMENRILVEIADSGIGIPQKHLNHVFDRFYRIDKSRSRQIGGSGLGLSIVKHIIEAHKQTINVRSSPGLGSTFGFTLKKA